MSNRKFKLGPAEVSWDKLPKDKYEDFDIIKKILDSFAEQIQDGIQILEYEIRNLFKILRDYGHMSKILKEKNKAYEKINNYYKKLKDGSDDSYF
jgi:hypothetical protein